MISSRAAGDKGRPGVAEVCAELLIGEYPRLEDLPWLKEAFAVTAIHNLQDATDLNHRGLDSAELAAACEFHKLAFVHTPVADDSGPDLVRHFATIIDALQALVERGHRVYLHCNGGLFRSPTVAAAFIHLRQNLTLDDAARHVKAQRICFPSMDVLEEYFASTRSRP